MHHPISDPTAAYRKVELEARAEGADAQGLTLLCLEHARNAIARAKIAQGQSESVAQSQALLDAHKMLVGLIRGIDRSHYLAEALETIYRVGLHHVEASMRNFDVHALDMVLQDLDDLLSGFRKG